MPRGDPVGKERMPGIRLWERGLHVGKRRPGGETRASVPVCTRVWGGVQDEAKKPSRGS